MKGRLDSRLRPDREQKFFGPFLQKRTAFFLKVFA